MRIESPHGLQVVFHLQGTFAALPKVPSASAVLPPNAPAVSV